MKDLRRGEKKGRQESIKNACIVCFLASVSFQNVRDVQFSPPVGDRLLFFALCHLKHNTQLKVEFSNEECPSEILCWTYIIR